MKKQVIGFIVILLFTISLSYNLYSWKYYTDFNKVETGLNEEIDILRGMIYKDEEAVAKLDEIEEFINFQQSLCFTSEGN